MSGGALLLGIGTAASAVGTYRAGQLKAQAYELEARAKEEQAQQVDFNVSREKQLSRAKFDRVKDLQISAFARSGVQGSSGSALRMLEETAASAVEDLYFIEKAGEYRKRVLMSEAGISRFLGDSTKKTAELDAITSILSGASKNPYMFDSPRMDKGAIEPTDSQQFYGTPSGSDYLSPADYYG